MLSYLLNQLFYAFPTEFYGEYGPTHIRIALIAIVLFLGLLWMFRSERKANKELKTLLSNHELSELSKKNPNWSVSPDGLHMWAKDIYISNLMTPETKNDCPVCPETCVCS